MPDVGVLQLTIQDNSKAAGQGLDFLAGALGRIKTAVSGGINLEGVSSEVTKLATVINGAKGTSSIISKLGTMFNAISKFSQIKGFSMKADEIREYAKNLGSAADALERNEKLTERNISDTNYWDNMLGTDNAKQAISKIEKNVDVFENTISRAKEIADGSGNYWDTFMRMGAFTSTPGKNSSFSQLTTDIDGLDKVASTVFITVENHVDTATASVSKMKNEVSDLINYLDKPISYKGLRDVADITAGVTRNNTNIAAEAAKSFDDKFFARLDKVNSEIDKTFEALNNPPNAEKNWTSVAFDQAMGIRDQYEGLINEKTSIFNTPELIHYLELLDRTRQQLTDFGNEHARIENQIKNNGSTESRIKALAQMERSYYFAAEKEQMYKAAIEEIIASNERQTETARESANAVTEQSEAMQKVAEASESLKASESNAKDSISDAVAETDKLTESTKKAVWMAEGYSQKFAGIVKEKEKEAALAEQIRAGQESHFYAEKPVIGMEQTNMMADNLTQLDLLKAQLQEAEGKYNQFVNELGAGASKTIKAGLEVQRLRDAIWEYNNALNAVTDAQEETETTAFSLSGAWSALKGAMTRMFPTLTSLLKRFKSMATMRALRYVIRQLAAGFSEGVQNVYHYSKAVGTALAPAMDQAATALQQMKNSIGAAVAPVIQALVPVLQSVVNWLITGINYLNQFFALLNGQSTWTRALPQQAEAYKDTTKEAKKAGSAMKDLLADWDELNIIQSQNGGGSGSVAADTAKDYATMFEEVNSFEDGVKNVLSFIEEHLGGLPGILKKAGAILLGWKLSKAFQGFLGDIGKLIAGGALVVLGVELSYGSGFSAGSKGFFDSGDIIGTIGGALATAIGGSLITTGLGIGGGIGFAIGIGVAVIATLTGWIEGQADFMDKMKWGDKEMTPDQIKDFIRTRFTFAVDPEITLLKSNIQNKEDAEADLIRTVNDFTSSLTFAKIQVGIKAANSVDALTSAYLSANEVIKSVQRYIDTTEKALAVTLSVSPIKDKNGNDITEELLKEVGIANTTLKDYFTELGKQLADAMYEGEKDGWTDGEMETVLALMEHQRNIVAKAEEMQRDITFEMNYRFNLNNLTRENAQDIMKEETDLINAYKEKFMKDRETAKEAAIKELAWTETAIEDYKKQGRDTTDLEDAAATYRKIIQEYGDPEEAEAAWKLKMEETLANMREDWIVALKDNYGILDKEFTEQRNGLLFTSVNSELTNAVYDAAKSGDPVGEASKALKKYFDEIKKQQPDYIQEMMDSLNLNVWDYANDEIKKNLASMLRNALGDDYAAMVLQSMRIPIDEIEKIFEDNYVFDPNNISFEGLKDNKWERPWWDILGLMFEPPEDVGFVVQAEPEIELALDERQVMTDLKNKIESALSDGQLDFTERTALELTFGKDAVNQILNELEYSLDEEGYSTGRGLPKKGYYIASAGAVSDVGWGSQNFVTPTNEQVTEEDISNGVASGTERANVTQNEILNGIARGVAALLQKQWNVNVYPSSGWGFMNNQSNVAVEAVTGDS